MDKEQILEMIDGTFIPNNVRGITAQGVKNVLKEMVNFTPESNGGGGSGAIIFYIGTPTLNDEGAPESFELTPEQQAHNAASFQEFKNSNTALLAAVDMSEFYTVLMGFTEMGITLNMSVCIVPLAYFSEEVTEMMGASYGECIVSMEDGIMFLPDGSVMTNA